jgi:hypothetical protein
MMDTSSQFDLSSLKVGDEVGIKWNSFAGQCEFVARVTEVDRDGWIWVEDHEFPFSPEDGREVEFVLNGVVTPRPNGRRLCPPSDKGRIESLCEDIYGDLTALGNLRDDLTVDQLRKLEAGVKALLAEFSAGISIDVSNDSLMDSTS